MQYILANLKKAKDWGFSEIGHAVKESIICLNEKEVMNNPVMSGTLAERAEVLGGYVASLSEAKLIINN